MNTMWAIDDFTEENGATVIYPRTHLPDAECASYSKAAYQSYQEAVDAARTVNPVQAVMPAGSVAFYRGSVLHGIPFMLTFCFLYCDFVCDHPRMALN